jgi:MEMO1 family protein
MTGKKILILSLLYIGLLAICIQGQSQTGVKTVSLQDDLRPSVAGQFYPGNKTALNDTLKVMFEKAVPKRSSKPVLAIVAPHAGYVFSGRVAASSFNQVEKKNYKNIFVIGSSHKMLFDGAAIYSSGNFITPLGTVKVDRQLCRKLMAENSCFSDNVQAFIGEHTIEVQLPFLQYKLGSDLNLVPIVIGTQSVKTCQAIAKALKPYFKPDNLFVFSTDMSHYPRYPDAQISDKRMTQAVMTNSPDKFLQTIKDIENLELLLMVRKAVTPASVVSLLISLTM